MPQLSIRLLRAFSLLALLALVLPCVFLGCGSTDSEGSAPAVDCNTATVPKFAEVAIFQKCVKCHGTTVSNRQGAPQSINFDNYASASANAKQAAAEVSSGAMPADHTPVTSDEKQALYAWAACGTPE
jgi:uncharacterized membrane protein